MSNPQAYLLRWRGRQFGPLAVDEIRRQLDLRELCPWHEALVDGQWVTLEELLALRAGPRQPAAADSERRLRLASAPDQLTCQTTSPAASARTREISGEDGAASSPNALLLAHEPREAAQDIAAATRPAHPQPMSQAAVKAPTKRVWFILLALSVGFTGFHNFYAGYWRRGAAQAVASVITTALGHGWILSWAWALVEAILVSRDRHGLPMT